MKSNVSTGVVKDLCHSVWDTLIFSSQALSSWVVLTPSGRTLRVCVVCASLYLHRLCPCICCYAPESIAMPLYPLLCPCICCYASVSSVAMPLCLHMYNIYNSALLKSHLCWLFPSFEGENIYLGSEFQKFLFIISLLCFWRFVIRQKVMVGKACGGAKQLTQETERQEEADEDTHHQWVTYILQQAHQLKGDNLSIMLWNPLMKSEPW